MEKEQQLYDGFVANLLEKITNKTATPKELEIVFNFIKHNNLQTTEDHNDVKTLTQKTLNLPFEGDDESPLRRVK